jgi:hypothetical protein
MMYRFKSRATSDLLMHQAVGQQLLTLLGKDPEGAGVILWQDMAHARRVLTQAAQAEAQDPKPEEAEATEDARHQPRPAHRALFRNLKTVRSRTGRFGVGRVSI